MDFLIDYALVVVLELGWWLGEIDAIWHY